MKKPYLNRIRRIGSISVWNVDGDYVRTHLGEEFTNFGQHYRFPFIPKNEFWIDKEHGGNETQYFVDHLLLEHRLMQKGAAYHIALEKADAAERRERAKSQFARLLHRERGTRRIARIHKRLLKTYSSDTVRVWLVRGQLVRDIFFIDFTEGGHDRVYPFVPKGEIWIDDDLSPRERRFVILHEMHERYLMATKHLSYPKAHYSASGEEYYCRNHPEATARKLATETRKNRLLS